LLEVNLRYMCLFGHTKPTTHANQRRRTAVVCVCKQADRLAWLNPPSRLQVRAALFISKTAGKVKLGKMHQKREAADLGRKKSTAKVGSCHLCGLPLDKRHTPKHSVALHDGVVLSETLLWGKTQPSRGGGVVKATKALKRLSAEGNGAACAPVLK
jgi:hypothetical protein